MLCDNTVWAGPDGFHFQPMFGAGHKSIRHFDDTMDIGYYDFQLARYVVMVRRDIQVEGKSNGVIRQIGRCETDDLSNWEKFAPADGCEVVFGPDHLDPEDVDVYTNSWTRYAGVNLFFPTMFHHFTVPDNCSISSKKCRPAPNGRGNDGLLSIRLVVSRDARKLSYVEAEDGRASFVDFGLNKCGPNAVHTTSPEGWCDMKSGVLAKTTFDTSGGYMVAGSVNSLDGDAVLTYASGQPFTHNGWGYDTWGSNTGIRLLQSRKHGFVSLRAGYVFNVPLEQLPQMATQPVRVPGSSSVTKPYLLLNIQTSSVGFAVVELRNPDTGQALEGFSFNKSDLIRGNTLAAAASWDNGQVGSLDSFRGKLVTVAVAMADSDLFSVWFGDLEHTSISQCMGTLARMCPHAAGGTKRCDLCVGRHQAALRSINCSIAQLHGWCSGE